MAGLVPFTPHFGLFFIRQPVAQGGRPAGPVNLAKAARLLGEPSATIGPDGGGGSSVDTMHRQSLLNFGADRIFRLCVSLSPSAQLEALYGPSHWCLSCHLLPRRHRHCSVHEAAPGAAAAADPGAEGLQGGGAPPSLREFINAGEERREVRPRVEEGPQRLGAPATTLSTQARERKAAAALIPNGP